MDQQEELQQLEDIEDIRGIILKYDPLTSTSDADVIAVEYSMGGLESVRYAQIHYPKLRELTNNYGIYEVEVMKEISKISTLQYIKLLLDRDIKEPIINIITTKMKQLTHMALGNSGLEDSDIEILSSHFPHLKGFQLDNNNITDKGLQSICKHNKGLEILNYSWIDIGVGGAKLIADNLKQLRVLILKSCEIGDEGIHAILSSLSLLSKLDAQSNRINGPGLRFLPQSLKVLELQYNDLKGQQSGIFHSPNCLQKLKLMHTGISDAEFESILKYSPQLETLLAQDNRITDMGIQCLPTYPCKISHLFLNNNEITDRALHHISGIKSVTHLSLNYCSVSSAGLIKIRNTQLKELYVTYAKGQEQSQVTAPLPDSVIYKVVRNNPSVQINIQDHPYKNHPYFKKDQRNRILISPPQPQKTL